jgi:IPT/TIG domain/FG-GAP repeat
MLGLFSPVQVATDRSHAEPTTASAGTLVPWRALAIAALLSLLLGAVLSRGLAGEHAPLAAAGAGATPQSGLASLPLTARAPLSAALGAASRAYGVSASGRGFRATNPAQRLHARFGSSGVVLRSGMVTLGLRLHAIGYGTALTTLGRVTPSAKDNRVSYSHAGVQEWYANGPLGVEQGFTIARAPSAHAAGELTLSMALSGNAHASLTPGGGSIGFSHGGGSGLRYSGLTATDATGRTLHSWLELHAGRLELRVDTRGARYPLTIDPLIQQGEKLTASEGDFAGFSVALSADGNTALIGAPHDNSFAGAALVFTRTVTSSGSTWKEEASLVGTEQSIGANEGQCVEEPEEPAEGEAGCGFGSSVALSSDGNTALIGGPRDGGYAGAAWVFTRSVVGSEVKWIHQGAKLVGDCTSSCGGPNGTGEHGNGRFGRSVALSADGSTAMIGAPFDHFGAAWVFTRSGSTWAQQERLTAGEGQGSTYFGASVSLSADGSTALAGDPGDSGHIGAAWVFTRSGSTWAKPGSMLTGGQEENGNGRFGFGVALSADASTAVIGARTDNEGAGAAWVFTRSGVGSGSTWSQQGSKLTPEGGNGLVKFGWSEALSANGGTALIGGRGDTAHRGAAWLFTRSSGGWSQQKLTGGAEQIGPADFGTSVALSSDGETALVGGPYDNGKDGAAWAFAVGPTVNNVEPNEGPASGGTPVTITGTSFTAESKVEFVLGETRVPATGVTFISETSITAISPPGKGKVDVQVTTVKGTSPVNRPGDEFTYGSGAKNPVHPTVTGISPTSGSTAGGTTVTITGTGFAQASAVEFGSKTAAYTIKSDTEITAQSPASPEGTVDVTVTTPNVASRHSVADHFTYVQPQGGASNSTTSSGTSGVLGFGPFVVSSCTVSLRGKTLAVQRYKQASVKLSWAGFGTCNGRLKLTVKQKVSHPKRGHKRFTIRTIGTGTFSIAPGAVRTVRVNLNKLGRSLLKARHGRLNASIAITKLSPGPVQARTASVRLALQKPRKAKKHTK